MKLSITTGKQPLWIILIFGFAFVQCGKQSERPFDINSEDFVSDDLVIDVYTDSSHIAIGDSVYVVKTLNGDSTVLDFSLLDSMIRSYDTITVDGTSYFIVEGDLLMDFDELYDYYQWKDERAGKYEADYGKLVAYRNRGQIVKWPTDYVIRYAIHRNSFSSDSSYYYVMSNFNQAILDWQATCNVRFEHIPGCDDLKAGCLSDSVDFLVREINSGSNLIAKAFFPNDPPHRRKVLINHNYYTTDFDKVGVLRHEVGHILGFRHEHIRSGAPADCGREGGRVVELTEYDPTSVMHYFCGGIGTKELKFSSRDITGAQKVYGVPYQ